MVKLPALMSLDSHVSSRKTTNCCQSSFAMAQRVMMGLGLLPEDRILPVRGAPPQNNHVLPTDDADGEW